MRYSTLFFILLFTVVCIFSSDGRKQRTYCKYFKQSTNFVDNLSFNVMKRSLNVVAEQPLDLYDRNKTQGCAQGVGNCFAIWKELDGTISFVAQGCWDAAHSNGCEDNQCSASRSLGLANDTKFCCCSGNFCNAKISDSVKQIIPHKSIIPVPEPDDSDFLTYVILIGSISLMVLFIAFVLFVMGFPRRKASDPIPLLHHQTKGGYISQNMAPPPLELADEFIDTLPPIDINSLEFLGELGKGKYGTVVKARYDKELLAVKKFPVRNDASYYDEVDIYSQPWMEHPNIVKFYGNGQLLRGSIEYALVLEYLPHGSLKNYLKENSVSAECFYRMSKTIAAGLAFLHTEISKMNSSLKKPSIVHRDLNPKNILVASVNGDCKICDFGLSLCVSGSKFYLRGRECNPHVECLHEAGTIRYLAPEMLESLTNLGECEMSLKQVDVYALALVIWEIAFRCHSFYQKFSYTPPYRMAYEGMIGTEATMELMQKFVTYLKLRPTFPHNWLLNHPALNFLKDVIESSWDTEAESRLPAGLIEDRLEEFFVIWEKEKINLIYIQDDDDVKMPQLI